MGGGDLNMKKSWHPLLLKNQERVWLEEKKALEEKKKLDQLRKEKEEERQLQELQRMQEEQTGKKRAEKLEWMYATPATGTSQNANDLEDYLLGKKRVDKILVGNDNDKLGASHKNFIATQQANTARDTAAKIRDDPLFAIKQQEQAAYEQLMSNPLRLREMQERNGIKPKKDRKDKREKKEKKHKHRHRSREAGRDDDDDREGHRRRRSASPYRRRRRSPSPYSSRRSPSNYSARHSRSPASRRRADSPPRRHSYDERRVRAYPRSDESSDDSRGRQRARTPERHRRVSRGSVDGGYERRDSRRDDDYERRYPPRRDSDELERKRARSPSGGADGPPKRSRMSPPPPPPRASARPTNASEDRAARLAAMTSNADSMNAERKERLTALLEQEKAELEAEERLRARNKGMASFMSHEQKKVFGGEGGLEDRLRRGRGGLVRESE